MVSNIVNIEKAIKIAAEPGPVYVPASYTSQKEAMQWINGNVFETSSWLNYTNAFDKFTINFITEVGQMQSEVLNGIIPM